MNLEKFEEMKRFIGKMLVCSTDLEATSARLALLCLTTHKEKTKEKTMKAQLHDYACRKNGAISCL